MSYHGKLQTLKNGTADAEIQLWAYLQLEKEPAELTDDEINLLAKAYSTMEGELNAPAFARAIMKRCGIISGTDK